MARGVVPFAIANGGPAEYINHGKNGYLYRNVRELAELTERFFALPADQSVAIRQNAMTTAREYSVNAFNERVRATIVEELAK